MEQKIYSTPEESPSQMPSSLELEAAAMRLKLQQNRKALEEQGIQSASDKLRQLNQQQQPQQQ
jgi:ERCC4-related helicase